MTYDDFAARALALPETSEEPHAGGVSVTRGGGWMFSLKRDGETIVLKLDWEAHDRLLMAHPKAVHKTRHYEGYPALLLRLGTLTSALADELIDASWKDAPNAAKKMPR